jgi:exosortase/archaeosortase family protein
VLAVRFAAGWLIVVGLLWWLRGLEPLAVRITVANLEVCARLLGQSSAASGGSLWVGRTPIEIVPDCTPMLPIATLWVAILAFPATWKMRLVGILVGGAVVWLYNLARILALVPVLRFHSDWFPFVHIYLWQTVTLLTVFGVFLLWLRIQKTPLARA